MIIYAKLQSSCLHHQYGIFSSKSQTSFSRNATWAGSEEGRLFLQANPEQAESKTNLFQNPLIDKQFKNTKPSSVLSLLRSQLKWCFVNATRAGSEEEWLFFVLVNIM